MSGRSVVLNATAYDPLPSGARSRSVGLAAALLRAGCRVTVLLPAEGSLAPDVADELGAPPPPDRFDQVRTALDPGRPVARALTAARELARAVPAGADLLVTDYYPVLPEVPTAVTVHDLRYLVASHLEPVARVAWFRARYARVVGEAPLVLTPTGSVATEVRDRLGVPTDRIAVVPNGLGRAWREAAPWEAGAHDHILFVGTADRRKDLPTALRALRLAADRGPVPPLVVAGRGDARMLRLLHAARDLQGRGLLRHEQAPSHRRLAALCGGAAALLHPSRYEGFGMPVVEALGLGVPVLAARCAAVEEVAGGRAVLLPPGDAEAWAGAIGAVIATPPPGAGERRARGREFTWDRAASALLCAAGRITRG